MQRKALLRWHFLTIRQKSKNLTIFWQNCGKNKNPRTLLVEMPNGITLMAENLGMFSKNTYAVPCGPTIQNIYRQKCKPSNHKVTHNYIIKM